MVDSRKSSPCLTTIIPLGNLEVAQRLHERCGVLRVSGRYHKLPWKIEDDYQLSSKVLGSGYNGVVRLATAKRRNARTQSKQRSAKFAVKTFSLQHLDGERKARMESEVEIFLSLDNPHVTRLIDVYEAKDTLSFVMECMEGGELFDRLMERKWFSEKDAAEAVWQMLLALNYIHQKGIVHRDIKLENFLYERKDSNSLKLIDFGFSEVWNPRIKMKVSCGTLTYVAPEVLRKSYTSQCDLWSLGVITFVLLSGYMPFSGAEASLVDNILNGRYVMKPQRWEFVSANAKNFTQALLEGDPKKRLTAQMALEHRWIANRREELNNGKVDTSIALALRNFGKASKFRRTCMEMMAWSLSSEERQQLKRDFVAIDKNMHGTITLGELKAVLVSKFTIKDEEIRMIFEAMDTNKDEEIHYSDFLAAMVNSRIVLHENLLRSTFRKFDIDNSGYITVENLREVLGDEYKGAQVDELLAEGDLLKDGRISYPEFVSYLCGTPLQAHTDVAERVVDRVIKRERKDHGLQKPVRATIAACRRISGGSDEGLSVGPVSGSGRKYEPLKRTTSPAPPTCCCIS